MNAVERGFVMTIVLASPLLGAAPLAPGPEPKDEESILAGADARIEIHRKADWVITVKTADGKPVEGATVTIEQTRHAFLFGSNIFKLGHCKTKADNEAYEKRFSELLNFATAPFYWWGYEVEQGKPRYEETDKIVKWCNAHRIALKGHPLMWNWVDPKWLPDDNAKVRQLQLDRITACVKRFGANIRYWDVVNEATQYERPNCLKEAPKLTAAGKEIGKMELVRQAFLAAHRANPRATLIINDYITDQKYIDEVITKLIDEKGKPLYDVIGIQCHQHGGAWTAKHAWEICERFAKFGVPLHFTEATILSGQNGWDLCTTRPSFDWPSTPEGEARQAREVVRFYTVLFSHPAVDAITWWDFTDQGSWQKAPAGFLRRDMSPKPAYEELRKLIKGRWWTTGEATTDAEGKTRFRAMCGQYRVTATQGDRKTGIPFAIQKGVENKLELRLRD